ncbi:hypothetical protein QTP88_021853 [Uroleucon formosanum]
MNIFEAFNLTRNELVFTRAVPEFTFEELGKATKRLPARRAPGPSGIPNESYLFKRARAASPICVQCLSHEDTAEHTLFACEEWEPFREELISRLGHRPSVFDVEDLVCGPEYEALPENPVEKVRALEEAEERFRLFYEMVERIMTAKEEEERARQVDEVRTAEP